MFSVVIPTYNRSDKLARALASVGGQSVDPVEIIVVDDGSEPAEAAHIAELVATTPGARLLVQPGNAGASVARNAGVAASTGRIIAFLDSDDWWTPNRLDRHRDAFVDTAVVASYNSASVTRGVAGDSRGTVGQPKPRKWSMDVALAGWNFVGGCSLVCVRRTAFDAAGGFDTSLPSCEDWDLWMKLAALGEYRFIDERLGYYDVGPHQRLTTSETKIMDGHHRLHEIARGIPTTPAEKRYVAAMHHWTMSEIALMFGYPLTTVRKLVTSLLTVPTYIAMRRSPVMLYHALRTALRQQDVRQRQ